MSPKSKNIEPSKIEEYHSDEEMKDAESQEPFITPVRRYRTPGSQIVSADAARDAVDPSAVIPAFPNQPASSNRPAVENSPDKETLKDTVQALREMNEKTKKEAGAAIQSLTQTHRDEARDYKAMLTRKAELERAPSPFF